MQGSSVATVILPGFKQDGFLLEEVLQPGLLGSDVLTYRRPEWGFDQRLLIRSLGAVNDYRHVVVYAESSGGLDAAAMLRAYPRLIINQLVLNGGMGSREDANAVRLIRFGRHVPGWAIPPSTVKAWQHKAITFTPKSDPGADEELARRAELNALGPTGRLIIGELRRMAATPPVQPREFAGRVGWITYIGAPGWGQELAESDPLVKLRLACDRWLRAVNSQGTIVTPPTWEGLHAPTPQKPGPVIAELRGAINRALT